MLSQLCPRTDGHLEEEGGDREREMERLQICVRMTDGISFTLRSHRYGNKGVY